MQQNNLIFQWLLLSYVFACFHWYCWIFLISKKVSNPFKTIPVLSPFSSLGLLCSCWGFPGASRQAVEKGSSSPECYLSCMERIQNGWLKSEQMLGQQGAFKMLNFSPSHSDEGKKVKGWFNSLQEHSEMLPKHHVKDNLYTSTVQAFNFMFSSTSWRVLHGKFSNKAFLIFAF